MQAVFETLFDLVYLITVITLGICMIRGNRGRRQYLLYGVMAVTLGCGDAFHLVPPLSWGIWRSIPFVILGALIVVLFYRRAREDKLFWLLWLAVVVSFGCYIPVVLFADTVPAVGMLMIPKTCAYVWAVVIGYRAMKQERADA